MNITLKSIILIAMGIFLYSRFWGGTLFFYINERFVWLIIFASIGFLLIGVSYLYRPHDPDHHHHHHDHDHDHDHDHQHGRLTWFGLTLLLSPILLGFLIPPRPLGASAMTNRDVSIESLTSAAAPDADQIISKPKGEKNILDWLVEFRQAPNPEAFTDQEIELVGFVYRDDRFTQGKFMVSRFVLSCCAADAAPIGLIVDWPGTTNLEADAWVEVKGRLQPGVFDGQEMPIIIAEEVTLTEIPDRPYLYPF